MVASWDHLDISLRADYTDLFCLCSLSLVPSSRTLLDVHQLVFMAVGTLTIPGPFRQLLPRLLLLFPRLLLLLPRLPRSLLFLARGKVALRSYKYVTGMDDGKEKDGDEHRKSVKTVRINFVVREGVGWVDAAGIFNKAVYDANLSLN